MPEPPQPHRNPFHCPKCRASLPSGNESCGVCGTHVGPAFKLKSTQVRPRTLKPSKTKPAGSAVIVAGSVSFLGLAVIILAAIIFMQKKVDVAFTPDPLVPAPTNRGLDYYKDKAAEDDRRRQDLEEQWLLQRRQELEERHKAEAERSAASPSIEPTTPEPQPSKSPPSETLPKVDSVDIDALSKLLAMLTNEKNPSVRAHAADQLAALLAKPYQKRDLCIVAYVLLTRSFLDADLSIDRLHVISPKLEITFEGAFEDPKKDFLPLRLRTGALVTASRSSVDKWTVQPPDGHAISDCQVRTEPDSPTREGAILAAHLAAFPPTAWPKLEPAQHIQAGKNLFETLAKAGLPSGQANHFLRFLAAAHFVAAMASPAHAAEAETLLRREDLEPQDGIWKRTDESRVLELASAIRAKDPERAAGLAGSEKTFRSRYLELIRFLVRMPLAKEAVSDFQKAFLLVKSASSSGAQAAHIAILSEHLSRIKICSICKGDHKVICERCAGKGQVRLLCGTCNGHGEIWTPPHGRRACSQCGGAGDKGMGACSGCKGEGNRPCRSCEAPFACPSLADIASWKECALCKHRGVVGDRIAHVCPRCLGLGSILIPSKNKTAVLR